MHSRTASPESAQAAALELLRERERFVLVGHVRPDGDCVGAQAALARVLGAMGKRVRVLNADPIDRRYDYLAAAVEYEVWSPGDALDCDVAVLLDFAQPARAGELGEALVAAGVETLVVDHHVHEGPAWSSAAWIDTSAAATGLVVARIAAALGVELDAVAAQGVFTSLVSDTGWFRYSNTDAEVLRVAAEMVARGVDVARVYGALEQRGSAERARVTGRLLAGASYHVDGRLALATVSLAESGGREAEVDDALDLLRAVESVEVALVLRETPEGACRLSARSKREVDMHALARRFGGGGHRRASGATLEGPLARAADRVRAAAEEALATAGKEALR